MLSSTRLLVQRANSQPSPLAQLGQKQSWAFCNSKERGWWDHLHLIAPDTAVNLPQERFPSLHWEQQLITSKLLPATFYSSVLQHREKRLKDTLGTPNLWIDTSRLEEYCIQLKPHTNFAGNSKLHTDDGSHLCPRESPYGINGICGENIACGWHKDLPHNIGHSACKLMAENYNG